MYWGIPFMICIETLWIKEAIFAFGFIPAFFTNFIPVNHGTKKFKYLLHGFSHGNVKRPCYST